MLPISIYIVKQCTSMYNIDVFLEHKFLAQFESRVSMTHIVKTRICTQTVYESYKSDWLT